MASSLVLIADDDCAVRRILARSLQAEGYSTLEAPDGLAALDMLRAINVDLVIVDMAMPGLGGQALCRAIRGDDLTCGTRIMVVTGDPPAGGAVELMDLDADDYMGKPFLVDEVLGRVRSLLHRAGSGSSPKAVS